MRTDHRCGSDAEARWQVAQANHGPQLGARKDHGLHRRRECGAWPLGWTKDYLPVDDQRIIAHTKVIGGGESASVKFPVSKLTKGGDYTFFCSFPGHYGLMRGKFIY